jgi:hypothetical protein
LPSTAFGQRVGWNGRQIVTGAPAESGALHIAMAPGGQEAGAKVGISTVAAADGGEGGAAGGAGIATAAAGTGGGGSGSGGGGTGTGAGTGAAAPVMLGARAIGPGADAGSTLG